MIEHVRIKILITSRKNWWFIKGQELVTGYQIEYFCIKFGLFYVASYLNLLPCLLTTRNNFLFRWMAVGNSISFVSISDHFNFIFSNGINHVIDIIVWIFITLAKAYLFLFISIMMRWALWRVRINQLLDLDWKFFLPIALGDLLLTASFYVFLF
jgi:NAD(P)H-quinone oxidoreductase subunit 1